MSAVREEILSMLTGQIIPFWKGLRDDVRGGYAGTVDFDLTRHPEADRGCIQNSRILWFFSEAYRYFGDPSLLDEAEHALAMLKRMIDREHGGIFWSVHPDGTPADTVKHTYNHAFAVYGLSACAEASGSEEALRLARELYGIMETRCRDENGYLEAFSADWRPVPNRQTSGSGVTAERTMNSLLHVMEAYTALYRIWPDPGLRTRLTDILNLFETKIYNPEKHRQEVFFDRNYRSLADVTSYGHDIETSWLTEKTLEVLDDPALTARIRPILLDLADNAAREAMSDHGFANECCRGIRDEHRCWWVQAEALMGFLNAWERTGEDRWRDAVLTQWRYIRDYVSDPRPGSEWFRFVHEDGRPGDEPIAEPWKCPYHNGRMALEFLRRNPAL